MNQTHSLEVTGPVLGVDDLIVPEPGEDVGRSAFDSPRLLRDSARHDV